MWLISFAVISSFHLCSRRWQHFFPFVPDTISSSISTPHLLYPHIDWWTPWLSPHLGYFECCISSKHMHACLSSFPIVVALTPTLAYSIECSPFLHSLTSTCYLPTYILLHNRENRNVQVKCLTTGVQPVSTFRGAFHSNVASHGENTASKECFLHIPLPHAVYVTQIPIYKTSLIFWDI